MGTALAEHIERIKRQGFTIFESLLSPELLEQIRAELSPYLQQSLMGRNNFEGFASERVYALLDKAPAVAELVEHETIIPILDAFLEPTYLLSANLAINVHPGETPQPFHADHASLPNQDRTYTNGISVIWAIDEFTADNGATELIPGSHLWQNQSPGEHHESVKAIMPAGSALVFHGSLYHRGGPNHSQSSRLAITPQYCQPWLRQLENMVLAVPPASAARYSEQVQGLLGYSIRDPGFMGYVDGVHPRRLIDQDYQGRRARGLSS